MVLKIENLAVSVPLSLNIFKRAWRMAKPLVAASLFIWKFQASPDPHHLGTSLSKRTLNSQTIHISSAV